MDSKMSIPSIFDAVMDIATIHGKKMRVSAEDLAKKDLFWVITRTRIKINDRPIMNEPVTVTTWPKKPDLVRCYRFCTVKQGDDTLVEAKVEWSMLSKTTGKISKISVGYPEDLQHLDDVILDGFLDKVTDDFSVCDRAIEYVVKSSDIDLSNHMNNVAYVRALFSAFTTKELPLLNVSEIETAYKNQCYEGELLTIKLKNTPDGIIAVMQKGETVCFTARLICNPIL
jgi:acyl-ACP thioesterase